MKEINIDEETEPIKVTVGGKSYEVVDISQKALEKMRVISTLAEEDQDINMLNEVLMEILGVSPKVVALLGLRKRVGTIKRLMETINEELSGKNVPEVVAPPQQS